MRRKLALLLGFAFGLALVAHLRRRRRSSALPQPTAVPSAPDERADELRRKLAKTRDAPESPTAEPAPTDLEANGQVDEDRQRVHEQARSVLEEMRRAEEE